MTRLLTVVCGALLTAFGVSCARTPQDAAQRFVARGDRFALEGRHDAALIEYRNAVRTHPAWSEGHQKMGNALEQLGRTDEAYGAYAAASRIVDGRILSEDETELRAVVERNPTSAAARVALAEVLLESRDMEGAEDQLLAATAAEPLNELANRALAALYIADGRMDQAESRLKIAAAQEPPRYRSHLALADFLMAERRYAEARPWLEKARLLRNDSQLATAVKLRLAAIDYEEGAIEAADRAVADLLAANASAEAWTLQADFRFREGNLTDALAAARQALSLDPQLAAAQNLTDTIRRQQRWR